MKKVDLYCEACGAGKAEFLLSSYDEQRTIPVIWYSREIGMRNPKSMCLCKQCLKEGLKLLEDDNV